MIVAILSNDIPDSEMPWVIACEKKNINYKIIDLTSFDWLNSISDENFDFLLTCPTGLDSVYKKMYDERIYILSEILYKKCYPSYNEIIIHENKVFLSYWLKANNLSHPQTYVFYNRDEALKILLNHNLPLVAKTNIGASGSGVKIIRTVNSMNDYINRAFSKKGISPKSGPNLKMGNTSTRLINAIKNPSYIKKRLGIYKKVRRNAQKDFVLIQEFIPHDFEWRIVKIGESYFGHKKIKTGDKASGTKGINYDLPDELLLNFVKDLCEKYNFNSMAVDLFEYNGKYYINELQTIFGHVQEYITSKNDVPGRFIFTDNWKFEEGIFNSNLSYDLRLKNALDLFS